MEKRLYKTKSSLNVDIQRDEDSRLYFFGYASVFDVLDKDGDVVKKGAFMDFIKNHKPSDIALLCEHDVNKSVGSVINLIEDDHGLFIEGFVDVVSENAKTLIDNIKNNRFLFFSIGYNPVITTNEKGINRLEKVNLVEVSFVNNPANIECKLLELDGIFVDKEIEESLRHITDDLSILLA